MSMSMSRQLTRVTSEHDVDVNLLWVGTALEVISCLAQSVVPVTFKQLTV